MTTCYHPEHRLFFVHIPKCAGTTLGGKFDLEKRDWGDSWLYENLPGWTRANLPNGHRPVREIEQWTGKPIEWWNKIIVPIRNPFEQQLSQWLFWRSRGRSVADLGGNVHPDDRFANGTTLEQFVWDDRSNGPNTMVGSKWRLSGGVYRWWCEVGGVVPPNVHIVKLEDLQSGMQEALEGVCDTFTPIPLTNTTNHGHWSEYYTPHGIRGVLRKFSWSLSTYYQEVLTEAERLATKNEAMHA